MSDEMSLALSYCRLRLLPARARRFSRASSDLRASPLATAAAASSQPVPLLRPPLPPSLFDVDCNLTHEAFAGQEEAMLSAAAEVGVVRMLVPGSTLAESAVAATLAARRPDRVRTTVGVHPYEAGAYAGVDALAALGAEVRTHAVAQRDWVVAVGECGLDYSEGFPERTLQLGVFEAQLSAACDLQLPLFVHERLAFEDAKGMFLEHKARLPPVLVHCFTGTRAELEWYIDMGFYISVSGVVCKEDRGAPLREILPLVPDDRLMVETDAPYLGFPTCREGLRKPKQQYPNVPSALPRVVQRVADVRGHSFEQVAAYTRANAADFFRWPFEISAQAKGVGLAIH